MASIEIGIEVEFQTAADRATTWAFLCDTPKTVGLYPKLKHLESLGNDQWQWELQPLGGGGFSHQIVYAVTYHFDEAAGLITWEPLPGRGNSSIDGSFRLHDQDSGMRVTLSVSGLLDVPVPRMLRSMARPYVEKEFSSQVNTFARTLSREIGRQ